MQGGVSNPKTVMLTPGKSAIEALAYLIDEHPDITAIKCVEYTRSKCSDECNEEKRIAPSEDMTLNRLLHDVQDRKWHRLHRSDATPNKLLKRITNLPKNRALAVTSRVTLHDHRKRHIPMVDFRCKPEEKYLQAITEWMQEIDDSGSVILRTADSYHYYGMSLLTDRQWVKFVGHCLLLVPDVDVRYLGHRLMEGWGSLRISQDPRSGTSSNEPLVVKIVEPKKQ